MFKNNKGFTLVEVIVSIALLAIIITPVSMMIIHQTNTTRNNKYKSMVQQNAQMAMAAFRTKCIPASGIVTLTDASGNDISMNNTANVKFSKFTVENSFAGDKTTYLCTKDVDNTPVFVYSGGARIPDIDVTLSPIPDTASYDSCKGVKVSVTATALDSSTNKTYTETIENQFYFRNKK